MFYKNFEGPLDTNQITRALTTCPTTSKYFVCCCAADRMPKITKYPASMVVNLDTSDRPGSHWVMVFALNKSRVLFFCPFGQPPRGLIRRYLKANFKKFSRNKCVFQPIKSLACGHFAMFVIYCLSKGCSFEKTLSLLMRSDNPDLLVRKFVSRLL